MQNRRQLLIIFLIYSGLWLVWFNYSSSQRVREQVTVATIREQARKAETEAANAQLSLSERLQRYQRAISLYQQVYGREGSKSVAIDARYQELRLLERMAKLEPQNTGYFDQAESLLKDMEANLVGKSAQVALDAARPEQLTAIADVGKDAARRLDEVRGSRDRVWRTDIRYRIMDFLVAMTGRQPWFSYWFALVVLTVVLKVLLWPFSKKQFAYMHDMQRIQPKVKELQEKLKDRPADEQQRRMMALYKEENVKLTGGCLPMIMQMVVLIPVYLMVRMYEHQFSKGYFVWIGSDLSQQWPMWLAKNLASFDVPIFLLYNASFIVMSLFQPKPADPQQAQQQKIMTWGLPIIFGVFMWFGKWSSAFMFYWLVQNLIGMWQNWLLRRQFPATPVVATASAAARAAVSTNGGKKPTGAAPSRNGGGGNGTGRTAQPRVHPKKKKRNRT